MGKNGDFLCKSEKLSFLGGYLKIGSGFRIRDGKNVDPG
jgi:hypothetical protein